MNNCGNSAVYDAELHSDFASSSARGIYFADFEYVFLSQFCFGAVRTVCSPPLFLPIVHIVGMRAKPKMLGVDTCWIIAFVKHMHAFGDGAVVYFPGNSMSLVVHLLYFNSTVATAFRTDPPPALTTFLYRTPKALFQGLITIFVIALWAAKLPFPFPYFVLAREDKLLSTLGTIAPPPWFSIGYVAAESAAIFASTTHHFPWKGKKFFTALRTLTSNHNHPTWFASQEECGKASVRNWLFGVHSLCRVAYFTRLPVTLTAKKCKP
jgi:hypothetical protein